MKLFDMFNRGSAPVARERLQILLAHERNSRNHPDLLDTLREEILGVISRHIAFEPDKVMIKVDRGKSVSTLEVDIEIPNGQRITELAPPHSRLKLDSAPHESVTAIQQGTV
jgi:cell division topological specificity factor